LPADRTALATQFRFGTPRSDDQRRPDLMRFMNIDRTRPMATRAGTLMRLLQERTQDCIRDGMRELKEISSELTLVVAVAARGIRYAAEQNE
jgi:hypothetical protein